MILEIVVLVLVLVVGFLALAMWLKNLVQPRTNTDELEKMVNQVFGLTAQKISDQSKQILSSERETIRVDLENKQKVIEKLVATLHDEMRERQAEIRSLEQDRTKKFGEISQALDSHRKLTDDLRISTQQLAAILSNNQARGEWGERIIEDLLQANGLIEGVHYAKQAKLTDTSLRPDITLLLPNHRNVPVDVKFPYAEIQKMALADSKEMRNAHLKQFTSDLKTKIEKVAEYIRPEYHTLDYAILFVPNEMVFSFINQKFPDLVDEALAKRVIIVSPFTFLIVARTVIESYRNFMIEDKLRDILQYIGEFVDEWDRFQKEFTKFGNSIDALKSGYDQLTTTRRNQMERKIKKIQTHEQGALAQSSSSTTKNPQT